MKRLLLITIILLGAFTACEKSPTPTPQATTIEVAPESLTFTGDGGEQEFKITSDGTWEITGGDGVVTFTPTKGKGNLAVKVTMKANETEKEITKTLKIKSGTLEKPVTVTQRVKSDIHVATAGTLGAILNANPSLKEASKLIITGTMNDADFVALKAATKATLKQLDIRDLTNDALPKEAFGDCAILESIDLPTSLTSIGDSTFVCCVALKSIAIPASVTSIGEGAFSRCRVLESIAIPDGVTSIGERMFFDCSTLESVTFGENSKLESIGDEVFYRCGALESIAIPAGVTSIGASAFFDCEVLTSIAIPDGVTSIATTFFNCAKLASVTFGKNSELTSIGNDTFSGCKALTTITIPDEVTKIGGHAFFSCDVLRSVTFGGNSSLTSIGKYTFYYCEALKSITIPASVKSIGEAAFANCAKLASVVCLAVAPPTLGTDGFENTPATKTLKVPTASVDTYKADTSWIAYFPPEQISAI